MTKFRYNYDISFNMNMVKCPQCTEAPNSLKTVKNQHITCFSSKLCLVFTKYLRNINRIWKRIHHKSPKNHVFSVIGADIVYPPPLPHIRCWKRSDLLGLKNKHIINLLSYKKDKQNIFWFSVDYFFSH